jgi:hypothetical protein
MSDVFRALCQELMDAIDSGIPCGRIKQSPLAVRVDAALAHPEPQGPTDERITSIAKAVQECARAWSPNARLLGNVRADDIDDLCNAVLARWGRPTSEENFDD